MTVDDIDKRCPRGININQTSNVLWQKAPFDEECLQVRVPSSFYLFPDLLSTNEHSSSEVQSVGGDALHLHVLPHLLLCPGRERRCYSGRDSEERDEDQPECSHS